jgi:hypothetical protein
MQTCDKCRAAEPESSYVLFDYCARCGKNLCPACMAKGCCGNVPAASGMEFDYEDDGGMPA